MAEFQKRIEQLMKEKHKTQLQITDKDGNIMERDRRIAELEVSATNSDKLNSIVKEKNNQIVILRKSQEDYQSEFVKLETKVDQLTSENARDTVSVKQKEERIIALKDQLEQKVNENHRCENDLQLKSDEIKSLRDRFLSGAIFIPSDIFDFSIYLLTAS